MTSLNQSMCCGIDEIYGIRNRSPEDNLLDIGYDVTTRYIMVERWDNGYDKPAVRRSMSQPGRRLRNLMFFSNHINQDKKSGAALCSYIRKNKLGKVWASPQVKNPNTRNTVQMWVWVPDKVAFKAWYKKNKKKRVDTGEEV